MTSSKNRSRRTAAAGMIALAAGALGGCEAVLGLGNETDLPADASSPNQGSEAAAAEAGPGVNDAAAGMADGALDATDATSAGDAGNPGNPGDAQAATMDVTAPSNDAPSGLSFTPSDGITAGDLSGDGLGSTTLASDGDTDASDVLDPGVDTLVFVDTGEITSGGVVLRAATAGEDGGTDPTVRSVDHGIAYRVTSTNVAVFTFGSLVVPVGATLKLIGAHAAAIASATTLTIDGLVEARAMDANGGICNAPTAPAGFAGGNGGANTSGSQAGPTPGQGLGGGPAGAPAGAGGGHAGVGGAPSEDAGVGGTTYDSAELAASGFHGGSGGGGGAAGGHDAWGGGGGAGGGAVRVVAAKSITIGTGSAWGGVNASGCGGAGGYGSPGGSGGGGGAGGAIVIEAPAVTVGALGALLAGGGGGGTSFIPPAAVAGGWSPSLTLVKSPLVAADVPAIVGVGCSTSYTVPGEGAGGNQGTLAGAAGSGSGGCAGGGGAGWIRIATGGANPTVAATALFSPTQSSGGLVWADLAP